MEDQKVTEEMAPNASRALGSFINIWLTDNPVGIKIIPSGWTDPRMYHVLVEWGDRDETDYHFLDAEQIKEQMDIEVNEEDFVSYIVTKDELKTLSNDYELGNHIRTALIK